MKGELFWSVSQRVQMTFISTEWYVYCVHPVMSKRPKQLSNCLKKAETWVVLIFFNAVLYHVRAYIAIVST